MVYSDWQTYNKMEMTNLHAYSSQLQMEQETTLYELPLCQKDWQLSYVGVLLSCEHNNVTVL